jgi:hypothetical protein
MTRVSALRHDDATRTVTMTAMPGSPMPGGHSAAGAHALQPVCQICGRGPACRIVARRHRALLVPIRVYEVKPTLCREHATKLLLDWTGRTLLEGWWGAISFVVANPATILLNLYNLAKARRLDPPHLSTALQPRHATGDRRGGTGT